MMQCRLLVVLATLAALLGAPSFASAAGNTLTAPSVSPTSGSITTVFTLRVTFDGKFPATGVTVSVAGLQLPMSRTSGTPEQGTWSASTLLPAGAWTPTFTSSSAKGNPATVTGPAIVVSGPTPPPAPAPTGQGTAPRGGEPDGGDPDDSPNPEDAADPGAAPADGGTKPQPTAADAAAATGSPSGSDTNGGLPAVTGSTGSTNTGDTDADEAPADGPAGEASAAPGAMPDSDGASNEEAAAVFVDDGLLTAVLVIGLSGVAAVGVIGTAQLVLARRRASEEKAPDQATDGADADASALLQRRTLRHAHMRFTDDPIVAAMGVDDQVAARRQRRRASQVGSGPGERPTRGFR